MTNLEKWQFYNRDLVSPDSFITWAFYAMISGCLQRRVFTGPERKPLFPNMYTILTGPPGIGKGLVLTEVSKMLRHWKRDEKERDFKHNENTKETTVVAQDGKEKQLLIPVGPEATTYEALVKIMSRSNRSFFGIKDDGKKHLLAHSSIMFNLEEISSLFRKHTEDLVNFLLVAYDCGDYRYETISRGPDRISNCCLNLLGGTTPGFIKSIFGDALIAEGFASRTSFVYELSSRFERFALPEYNQEQIKAHGEILDHIKLLGNLSGKVNFTNEALEFMTYWWENEAKIKKANNSPKLIPYYARKGALTQKLAMAVHFADSVEPIIQLDSCMKALRLTEQNEKKMHFAVTLDDKNKRAKITEDLYLFLQRNGPQTQKDLIITFYADIEEPEQNIPKILSYLMMSGKIVCLNRKFMLVKE